MKPIQRFLATTWVTTAGLIHAASPGDAPQLPVTGTRVVNVSTEAELQSAMNNLQSGDTILLANGTYNLTRTLYINGRHNVTLRGLSGSTNVTLVGRGMNNANHGDVPFGIWSNSTNTTIAHLTLRETWDNEIIFNTGAQSPRVYCVRLINAGSQFIKANPTDVNAGLGVNNGVVEYCWFEYTGSPPDDHGAGVGYFNGISAHAAKNWMVRGNLFKNLHNPDGTAYPWNPAVLFWRNSSNTVTERNIFINVDRAVAYGLDQATPYREHTGGVIRNNFVHLTPGLLSASRRANSDGAIIVWNSPGTQVDHNTILLNDNEYYAVQFRFATSSNGVARNNLTDAPIHLRDGASAVVSGNLSTASPALFVNPAAGDLHLLASATNAIDRAAGLLTVTNDFDGERRPRGATPDLGADEFNTNAPPVISGFWRSGPNWTVSFTTLLGLSYDVQRAGELVGAHWSLAISNLAGNGGLLEATDSNVVDRPSQFYRVSLSP